MIDGKIDPGEWDAAGPPIVVTADRPLVGLDANPIPEDPYGGAEDLSFQFRTMWVEPWTAYILVEVTDDIAMEEDPPNLWERDQIELFFDGDDLEGNEEYATFEWWGTVPEHTEPYGKFGVSRYNTFEGNPPRMSENSDDIYADDEANFIAAAARATETGEGANYFVEYAVSMERMYLGGMFDADTVTSQAQKLVADHTKVKSQIALSDDDNFEREDGSSRSHTLAYLGLTDWRATNEFADFLFLGPYSPGTSGDFDGDGDLDAADIDALSAAVRNNSTDTKYDVNGDTQINDADRTVWVETLKNTYFGDANLDGEFNSADFVAVFTVGKYESGNPAQWAEGDWNGDALFNSSDFVTAFSAGGYELGPRAAVASVPEPAGITLLLLGLLAVAVRKVG
jgi:hypothetical protein